MRKFFTYPVFLVLFLSFIGAMGFGAIVKYHYDGGEKYQFLQKPVMLISSVPKSLNRMIKLGTLNFDKPDPLLKHKDKKQFEQFIEDERNGLLVSSRYDYNMSRSVVDIIDLKNFKIIHTYKHDISKMHDQIWNKELYSNININQKPQ
jgi:hypothetical protein